MEDFQIRKAEYKDVPEIMNVIDFAVKNLQKKNLFFADTKEFVTEHIENKGFALVATSKDKVAGYILVRYPGKEEDNLGKHLNENIDLNKVAHMESTAVLPEFRNKGIQKTLLKYAEKELENTNYCYYMSTVDPENEYSMKTLIGRDYKKIDTVKKYGGLNRNIMMKKNIVKI